MKPAALLAETLCFTIFEQAGQLEMLFADAVASVVVFLIAEILVTTLDLQQH